MRRSIPIPRATSRTSARRRSQIAAISFMKLMRVARKALEAYLIISAVRRSVITTWGGSSSSGIDRHSVPRKGR